MLRGATVVGDEVDIHHVQRRNPPTDHRNESRSLIQRPETRCDAEHAHELSTWQRIAQLYPVGVCAAGLLDKDDVGAVGRGAAAPPARRGAGGALQRRLREVLEDILLLEAVVVQLGLILLDARLATRTRRQAGKFLPIGHDHIVHAPRPSSCVGL